MQGQARMVCCLADMLPCLLHRQQPGSLQPLGQSRKGRCRGSLLPPDLITSGTCYMPIQTLCQIYTVPKGSARATLCCVPTKSACCNSCEAPVIHRNEAGWAWRQRSTLQGLSYRRPAPLRLKCSGSWSSACTGGKNANVGERETPRSQAPLTQKSINQPQAEVADKTEPGACGPATAHPSGTSPPQRPLCALRGWASSRPASHPHPAAPTVSGPWHTKAQRGSRAQPG